MNEKTPVCITGGTGLVGSALAAHFHRPTILSRRKREGDSNSPSAPRYVQWDPHSGPPPSEAIDGHDVLFHLAGEPVAKGRWTEAKKQRIRDSRVLSTQHLVKGIQASEHPPKILICASAVGYYGSCADEILTESSAAGSGFLPEVCVDWEKEATRAETFGVRVVTVRIGIVLSKDGGAIAQMRLPFQMGVGGRLGDGQQWMSWIHIDDMVGLLLHAAEQSISGAMNAVAPNPVTNAEFTRVLGQALHRPTVIPVPRFALKLGFGEMSDVLLQSQRVYPRVALQSGYTFRFPELKDAMADALGKT